MKLIKLKIGLVLALFFFCATTYALTPSEIEKADYGEYPKLYQVSIKSLLEDELKDFSTATYEMESPKKGYWYWTPLAGKEYSNEPNFCYITKVTISAKNKNGTLIPIEHRYFASFSVFSWHDITTPVKRGDAEIHFVE